MFFLVILNKGSKIDFLEMLFVFQDFPWFEEKRLNKKINISKQAFSEHGSSKNDSTCRELSKSWFKIYIC